MTDYIKDPLGYEYVVAEYGGRNTSGIKVWGKNLLVLVDECAKTTSGGVELVDDSIERRTAASTTGVIYAVGPEAFRLFDDGTRWHGEHPDTGDRVWFEKYAGVLQTGIDQRTYRIMDYRAISGTIDQEMWAEFASLSAAASAAA